ncbi:hypothetical protein ACP70R_013321 [Stipagrostis hirtigluma subsp. patula]
MIHELDADRVVGYFRGKSILITGSTGFLGKVVIDLMIFGHGVVLLEKILRVQPDVKKLFLLVRAVDVETAKHRVQNEWREIFQVLKEKHGNGFEDFIQEKLCPLAGDIVYENLGLCNAEVTQLSKEIDIIIDGAATTNFYERYDVAFDTNVLGVKHICEFAKRCIKLKMLLHVSTAYVAGEQEGILLEKQFLMGETLREGVRLEIESEQNLIKETRRELRANCSSERTEKRAMKELGLKRAREFGWPNTYVFTKAMGEMLLGNLRGNLPVVIVRPSIITSILKEPLPGWMEGIRTIDSVIIGYVKQALSFFLVNPDSIMDVIPGDMVVNAMMVAMAAHSEEQAQTIYHVTSSLCNPANYNILAESAHRYFLHNPPCFGKDGKPLQLSRMRFFSTWPRFRAYMTIKYKLPLEILRLVDLALCGPFSRRYNELSRKYLYVMHLVELYAPYTLFKGCFDDTNTERLRVAMNNKEQGKNGRYDFDFDPKSIDWYDYFYRIHIPGVVKYLCD